MFKEHDVVQAKHKLSELVFTDCKGTIVMIYETPTLAYEVEFIDDDGITIELLTVAPCDVVCL